MLQRSLISLACILFANAIGIFRAPVPHLVKGSMRDWTGSQTTLLIRHRKFWRSFLHLNLIGMTRMHPAFDKIWRLSYASEHFGSAWLDKTRFHVIGAILFTAQSVMLHPIAVVKTRMQVAGGGFAHMNGFSLFRNILRNDGIPGIFRGFGTSAIGGLPGRVLSLTSLEVSKDRMLKVTENLDMSEATRIAVANGAAGLLSNLVSCAYFVPLEVVCQRLMVQGLPGMTSYNSAFDAIRIILKTEGYRGLYRGFGLTVVTQSPASALWWGVYGAAQHIIWRSLGFGADAEKRPSQLELVTVQATAGTVAGASSSVITTPVDTIKTRLQVMDNYGTGRPSVIATTRLLLEEDGWRGFYRGFGPRFLNMSLWGTSMIVTYELIKRLSLKRD